MTEQTGTLRTEIKDIIGLSGKNTQFCLEMNMVICCLLNTATTNAIRELRKL
jgi:hypothetical protein